MVHNCDLRMKKAGKSPDMRGVVVGRRASEVRREVNKIMEGERRINIQNEADDFHIILLDGDLDGRSRDNAG